MAWTDNCAFSRKDSSGKSEVNPKNGVHFDSVFQKMNEAVGMVKVVHNENLAIRFAHPFHFRYHSRRIGDNRGNIHGHHHIESVIGKSQLLRIHDLQMDILQMVLLYPFLALASMFSEISMP